MNQEKAIDKKRSVVWIGIVCIGAYIANYYLRNMLSVAMPELLLNGDFTETSIGIIGPIAIFVAKK